MRLGRKVLGALLGAAAVLAAGLAPAAAGSFSCETDNVLRHPGRLEAIRTKLERGQPVAILAIGSSSTEGVGATSPALSYPAVLEKSLRAVWPGAAINVLNSGKGGETADETLARLADHVEDTRFDLVIWQVGTNDALRSGDGRTRVREVLHRGLSTIRASGAATLIVDPQYFPKIENSASYAAVVEAISDVAGAEKVALFSRFEMMKVWRDRSLDDLRSTLADDQFHMNDRGYDCLATRLARDVAAMVGEPSAVAVSAARR